MWMLASALAIGCAQGGDPAVSTGGATFAGSAPTTMSTTATPATTDAPATATGQTGSAESTTDDPTSDGTASESDSSSNTDTPTSGPDTDGLDTDGLTTGDDATTTGVASQQPADGMYSDCLSSVQCIGLTTCLTVLDGNGQATDGFCTSGGCNSPLAQCDPTPGGNTMPICFPIEQNGNADTVCALDCSAGQACPAGMQCQAFSSGSICT